MAAIDDRRTVTKTATRAITGADVLVESLVRHDVDVVFAYPGGASMPMHQALTRYRDRVRTILPRHEQGGIFAAEGYARATGKPGVVMATSGPGALNLVTGLADAKMDSVPLDRRDRPGSAACDRHGRVPGNADGGGVSRDHQAPLPGSGRQGYRQDRA